MNHRLRAQVRERAGRRCEYCRIHEHDDPFFTFPVDHVVAQQHGGSTTADNLCFSCFRCNVHKGPNLTSVDPLTAATVRLFHPRRDVWEKHFHWEGSILAGDTPIGRATIRCLAINHPDAVLLRELLLADGQRPSN